MSDGYQDYNQMAYQSLLNATGRKDGYDANGNPIITGMNGDHDMAGQYGTGANIAPGLSSSGIRAGSSADDPWLQFWTGQSTPTSMQTNLGPTSLAAGPAGNVTSTQNSLLSALQAQAMGQGPSLATQTMQAGMQQNLRGAAALAASGRNPSLGGYNAIQSAGAMNQNTAQQAAMARTQEQLNAQGLLGNYALGLGGQQIGLNEANAGYLNQANLAQGQLNQSSNQFYNNMLLQQFLQANGYLENKDVSRMNNNAAMTQGVVGGLSGAGGAGLQGLAMAK